MGIYFLSIVDTERKPRSKEENLKILEMIARYADDEEDGHLVDKVNNVMKIQKFPSITDPNWNGHRYILKNSESKVVKDFVKTARYSIRRGQSHIP